ncbi:hypothetical protein HSBAA_46540 [Vreelandella sulfidaeris]|uniref:Uncharacterized protein n=1 Tax=Vreelandella sulfidaeris TaxID=115553 RepID=A0A455UGC4_9GAMM|nr:hypothetical protein HSBAA_46540 [Halomonas sulfidaeris]
MPVNVILSRYLRARRFPPLLEAGPWLLDIEVGSEAWHCAEKLCQQRLGWVCQPPADQNLQSIADHLRALLYWMTRTAANH